jgi:hypothetical protein
MNYAVYPSHTLCWIRTVPIIPATALDDLKTSRYVLARCPRQRGD